MKDRENAVEVRNKGVKKLDRWFAVTTTIKRDDEEWSIEIVRAVKGTERRTIVQLEDRTWRFRPRLNRSSVQQAYVESKVDRLLKKREMSRFPYSTVRMIHFSFKETTCNQRSNH